MPNIRIGEADKSTFADQQFIQIAYNGKVNNNVGGGKLLPYRVEFISENEKYYIIEVGENQKITAPNVNPVKEGYTFKAWQLNGTDFDFSTIIETDITLTAKFEETSSNKFSETLDFVLSESGYIAYSTTNITNFINSLSIDKHYVFNIDGLEPSPQRAFATTMIMDMSEEFEGLLDKCYVISFPIIGGGEETEGASAFLFEPAANAEVVAMLGGMLPVGTTVGILVGNYDTIFTEGNHITTIQEVENPPISVIYAVNTTFNYDGEDTVIAFDTNNKWIDGLAENEIYTLKLKNYDTSAEKEYTMVGIIEEGLDYVNLVNADYQTMGISAKVKQNGENDSIDFTIMGATAESGDFFVTISGIYSQTQ